MMRSAGLLLNRLVGFWEPNILAFRVQGERVDLTLTDVYFLTGLPCLGRVADTQPRVSANLDMDDMLEQFCGPEARVHRNALLVRDLREPEVQSMAACVVRVLGSQSPERVSGGQMQLVECVLGGVYYAWGQMFLTCVQWQLTTVKESGKGFCYGSFLCAFFMERVPTLRPRVPIRAGGVQ